MNKKIHLFGKTIKVSHILLTIIMFGIAFLIIAPFLWVLSASFRTYSEAISLPPKWLPPFFTEMRLGYFKKLFSNTIPFFVFMKNSLKISVIITLSMSLHGAIAGYAYAGAFVGRAAYDWSCETSIYLDKNARRCGIGKTLYAALEKELKKMGILNMYACIGYPDNEDEYLTKNSAEFHSHIGFVQVGEFHKCGYKFGRWYNMIWMEKIIGEHKKDQAPVIGFKGAL